MRIGILLPLFSEDASKPLERARRAEELGFDGAFAFDHLVPLGGPADGPSLEAYSVLAAVAASTERLTLGTLVTRVTLRHTGLLAKQAAGLDEMSEGRFVLAMGTGDEASRIEAESFGFNVVLLLAFFMPFTYLVDLVVYRMLMRRAERERGRAA